MSDRINTGGKVLKPFLLGVLTVVVVQVIGVVIVVMMGLIPANADARPSRLEARLAGLVREAYVTRAEQTTDVTVNPTKANLSDGAKLYKDNCMGCHGGPEGTYRTFGRALYPPAPRFADKGTDLSDAEFYWTTQHGLRWTGMPSFGGEAMDRGGNKLGPMMKPDEMRKINAFVHHIQSLPPAADAEWKKKSPAP
jgi:mono/diheme cytochrome c family protein